MTGGANLIKYDKCQQDAVLVHIRQVLVLLVSLSWLLPVEFSCGN